MKKMLLALVLVGIVGFLSFRQYRIQRGSAAAKKQNGALEIDISSIPITHTMDLGSFTVAAGETHPVKVVVDTAKMQDPRISGHFKISENPEGIRVLLLDQQDYDQFEHQQPLRKPLFTSEKTAEGNVDAVPPSSGTYYLVFQNSSATSKTVNADLKLHYFRMRMNS